MSDTSTTGPLTLRKAVDADNARTYLKTTLAADMDTLNGAFNTSTGHDHDGSDSKTLTNASLANRTRNIFIPAGAMIARLNTPALAIQGANTRYQAWTFDSASDEDVLFDVVLPEDFTAAALTVKLYWTNLAGGSGDVVWAVFAQAFANTEDLNDTTGEQTGSDTITAPAQNVLKVSSSSVAITPAVGDFLRVIVRRDGDNVADTLGNDAGLVAVEIEYIADS